MNRGFATVLAASEQERRDLFIRAAYRLGTAEQNIEKDFWVCWTHDALFNRVVVKPYIADDLPSLDLIVDNVTTVDPSRTFWDKVVILHGLRRWWDRRGELKGGGQNVSRHYYDVYRLWTSQIGRAATQDATMAEDRVRHARMFFNRSDLDLASAVPGSFALSPGHEMLVSLRRDYEAMCGMIFATIPSVDEVVAAIAELEQSINKGI